MSTISRIRTVMVAVLVAAIIPVSFVSADCGSAPSVYHPVSLSLFPPISTNWCQSGSVSTTLSLNILGGYVGELRGLELGTLFNVEAHNAAGLQLAGGVNVVGAGPACPESGACTYTPAASDRGGFTGLQVAAGGNIVLGDVLGAQIAAVNIAGGNASFVQLGAGNYAGDWATTQFGAGNVCGGSTGFQLGGFNFAHGDVVVAQLGGINAACGNATVQLGALNGAGGSASVQLGGINAAGRNTAVTLGGANIGGGDNAVALGAVNVLRGPSGVQLGGINVLGNQGSTPTVSEFGLMQYGDPIDEKCSGLQLGALNIAGGSTGAQVGAINIADRIRWFQLGGFNFARESDIPIGPLNVILNGQFRVHVFASEAPLAGFELKTGGRYFYNVLSFGYQLTDPARMMFGYGVGGHFPCLCPRLFVDTDIVGYRVNPADDMMNLDGMSYLAKLRLTAGWQIAPPVAITGGLAGNVWLSDKEDGSEVPFVSIPMYKSTGSTKIAAWPGVSLGLELRLI